PPAEADDPATAVADGEDDAVAKAIILTFASRTVLPRFIATRLLRRTVLALDDQPGLDHVADRLRTAADGLQQVVPARWGEADAEGLGDLSGQAALLQIVDGPRLVGMTAQLLLVELVRERQYGVQFIVFAGFLGRFPAFF